MLVLPILVVTLVSVDGSVVVNFVQVALDDYVFAVLRKAFVAGREVVQVVFRVIGIGFFVQLHFDNLTLVRTFGLPRFFIYVIVVVVAVFVVVGVVVVVVVVLIEVALMSLK